MEYKVTEKYLIGEIAGLPIEVVQKMVERQSEQGNKPDVSIFQEDKSQINENLGFSWSKTIEGYDFWNNVICLKRFNLFFSKYPKPNQEDS